MGFLDVLKKLLGIVAQPSNPGAEDVNKNETLPVTV
jgi:hypothetical protein